MSDWRRPVLIGVVALALAGCGGEEEPPSPDQLEPVDDLSASAAVSGREIYDNNCLTCHQADGSGAPRLYPALHGSQVATGDVNHLVRMTLVGVGLGGHSLEPSGEWGGVMNGSRHLSDAEIAAVLTYIRQAWGNDASAVSPEQVAEVRREIFP